MLRQVTFQVDGFCFLDVGSLFSCHGNAGMFIKVVFLVLAAVVNQEILFFVNQL